MLDDNVILDARIGVLEHQVSALTDALVAMMESYKILVTTMTIAQVKTEAATAIAH